MGETIRYIISFLLDMPLSNKLIEKIGYTNDEKSFSLYDVVIIPSHFFDSENYGSPRSLPKLPLKKIENTPILFGEPKVEFYNHTLIVYADIIASSYFFLSQYEEWISPNTRDQHGRFVGQNSIAYKEGFITRPIVDEYGVLLKEWLRKSGVQIEDAPPNIKKIYLTHDVDEAFKYKKTRNIIGALLRSVKNRNNEILPALKCFFGRETLDPYFSYPWILEMNKTLENKTNIPVESIFFFKSHTKNIAAQDKPTYNIGKKGIQKIFFLCKTHKATIGLHGSYFSKQKPQVLKKEHKKLEETVNLTLTYNRQHYLRTIDANQLHFLKEAGITDDFSYGYADISGFRLGTSHPVCWINPETKEVDFSLRLHPLQVMDCSLSEKKYMNFTYKEAYNYVINIIQQVKKHNGELILLWHNQIFSTSQKFNHRKFYSELIEYLISNQ